MGEGEGEGVDFLQERVFMSYSGGMWVVYEDPLSSATEMLDTTFTLFTAMYGISARAVSTTLSNPLYEFNINTDSEYESLICCGVGCVRFLGRNIIGPRRA